MMSVVEDLLNLEYIRELEDRGVDADEDFGFRNQKEGLIEVVEAKQKRNGPAHTKKKQSKGKTISIVNIRQTQHARPATEATFRAAPDPWHQIASLSAHLASLLPPHPESYFSSALHSPEYDTPAAALRACLMVIGRDLNDKELSPQETAMLFNLFDLLQESPGFSDLSPEERTQVMTDAQLALSATNRRPDEAMDIVSLLRELDADAGMAMGIYHSPAPTSPALDLKPPLMSSPTLYRPPKAPFISPEILAPDSRRKPPPKNAWQTVPAQKKRVESQIHPLAESIPAYNPMNGIRKGRIKGHGNNITKELQGASKEVREAERAKNRMRELRQDRDHALREATRAWARGHKGYRGGEIALYYAERVSKADTRSCATSNHVETFSRRRESCRINQE
jgi:hypothetical protein